MVRVAPPIRPRHLGICLAGLIASTVAAVEGAPVVDHLASDIAKAVANRRASETRATLLVPELDATDVALLSDDELRVDADQPVAAKAPFARDIADEWRQGNWSAPPPPYNYRSAFLGVDGQIYDPTLAVDPSLAAPHVSIDLSDPLYPVVSVERVRGAGNRALFYFEFDTSPDFNSPNHWQYPALMPSALVAAADRQSGNPDVNRTDGAGTFDTSFVRQRAADGTERRVRFPFRVTAMRLPPIRSDLTFDEMERQAIALGYGLDEGATIEDIFRYVRQTWVWGDDTLTRRPINVFRAGVAECASFNALVASLLEMNGIRARLVSGFNPKYRVVAPSSGHTALEVFDARTRSWSYLDPYLDVLLSGVSAERLAQDKTARGIPMSSILPQHRPMFGAQLSLAQLFDYRVYGDTLSRLPMTSMLTLRSQRGEARYGTTWELNVATPRPLDELFPVVLVIHVRVRYLIGSGELVQYAAPEPALLLPKAPSRASPWAHASFTVNPRALLSGADGAARLERFNPCRAPGANLVVLRGPFDSEQGHARIIRVDGVGPYDSLSAPAQSELVLCEDRHPLGPAHAAHQEIRDLGRGRFSHWEGFLYFSTSDNSDPNENRRTYEVVRVGAPVVAAPGR